MNKSLDDRFEQARQQLRAELPLEQLSQRLASAPKPSFWTFKKIIGMNSLLLSIIATAFYWQSANIPPAASPASIFLFNGTMATPSPYVTNPLDTPPPTPVKPPVPPVPPKPPVPPVPPKPPVPPVPPRPIAPQKTFTEYTLEIRKDNSEQQLQKLQQELEQYGIQMRIDQLTYRPNGTIKRFKGQFDTDSLFCGEAIQAQTFDVSGSFQVMSFTFRVAESNHQLKYLKIAMDDEVEQTIECYDDEILSDAKEAQRLYILANNERANALRAAAHAKRDLARVHADINRAKTHYLRFKTDSIARVWASDSLSFILEHFHTAHSVEHLLDSLRPSLSFEYWKADDLDTARFFQNLQNYENRLRFELKNWELDQKATVLHLLEKTVEGSEELEIHLGDLKELEADLLEELEIHTGNITELETDITEELELVIIREETEAAKLEHEAKRLKQEAKTLQKVAKLKAKLARQKAKAAKRRAK